MSWLRIAAVALGVVLALAGISGLRETGGRGAASALVLAAVAFAFAWSGRIPNWFRK